MLFGIFSASKVWKTTVTMRFNDFVWDNTFIIARHIEEHNKILHKVLEGALERVFGWTQISATLHSIQLHIKDIFTDKDIQVGPSKIWGWVLSAENLSNAPVLTYYYYIIISVGACSYGLGTCLFKDDRLVAYASCVLTSSEYNYAQIEKEMLAIS